MDDLSSALDRAQRMRQGKPVGALPPAAEAADAKPRQSRGMFVGVMVLGLLLCGFGGAYLLLSKTEQEIGTVDADTRISYEPAIDEILVEEPAAPIVIPEEVYMTLDRIPVQGFVDGGRTRVLIGGRTYSAGDVLDDYPEAIFIGIRDAFVVFEISGYTMEKRF